MHGYHPLTTSNPDLNSGYSLLLSLAHATPVERPEAAAEELISIPDAWAQVEVFRAALTDNGHPLHARAVAEWRGLIAIFALAVYHGRDVSTQPLQLAGINRGMIGILNRMSPAQKLTGAHHWDQIGLIRLHGHAVGLLVPTTLVCPRRRPPAELVGAVPWIIADRIIDPLTVPGVGRPQRLVLAEFCREAAQELRSHPEFEEQFERRGLLAALVAAFDQFRDAAATGYDGPRDGARFDPRTLHLRLPGQPIYSLLSNATSLGGGSHLPDRLLAVRPELQTGDAGSRHANTGLKGFLLIDPNMPDALGLNAAEINVLGNANLQMVLNQPDVRRRLELDATAAGYLCVTPNDLFTDYFYRANNAQIDAQPREFRDALVPVTPAVMMMMSPDELRDAITFGKSWDDVIVTLRLRLSLTGGYERYYTIQKTYGTNEIISAAPPTTLGFWPDFQHPDWRWHFAYYGGTQRSQFAPRTFVSAGGMAAFINAGGGDPGARVGRARQLIKEPILLADRLPLAQTVLQVELYKSEFSPEALYCDHALEDQRSSGFVESGARKPVGILLLPPRGRVDRNTQHCKIGIDFGTVNTTVYWKRETSPTPEPLQFRDRQLLPFAAENELARGAYVSFLPLAPPPIPVPFMTVLRDRNATEGGGSSVPLWASYIFYVTDVERAIAELEEEIGAPLRFDLKWEQGGEDRRPVQAFLAQAALQSLAEAAAVGISPHNVEWRFSYPEAYSRPELGHFETAARTAVRWVMNPHFGAAPPEGDDRPAEGDVSIASESLSAALYFISKKRTEAPPTGHLVTIDMGGLTSDVSIWARGRLIWRNSLKLAGRDIAIRYLNDDRNFQVVRDICASDPHLARLIDRLTPLQAEGKRRNAIEILMNSRSFARAFDDNFHLIAGDSTRGQGLNAAAELALLGILYYVGKTIRYCTDHPVDGQHLGDAHFSVCLGGRTSMLYRALFKGGKRQEYLDSSLGVFKDAAPGLVRSANTVYTDDPKHEVAYGLVIDASGERDLVTTGHRVEQVILGEQVQMGGALLPADAVARGLDPNAEWEAAGIGEISAFLASVNRHSGMLIQLAEGSERRITNAINNRLKQARSDLQKLVVAGETDDDPRSNESTVVEPPFIVAVRELVAMVIDSSIAVRMR
jgi:hypothetical protein